MSTTFICLANSWKHRGRCLAGIEVSLINDGQNYRVIKEGDLPKWIRPVSINEHGELPTKLVGHIKLLDLVEMDINIPMPNSYQSENVNFIEGSLKAVGSIYGNHAEIEKLLNHTNENLFGSHSSTISIDEIDNVHFSLILIKVTNPVLYYFTDFNKNQLRAVFNYKDYMYDLPITDYVFAGRYSINPNILIDASYVYFTISVGTLYNNKFYKLIAGVLLIQLFILN